MIYLKKKLTYYQKDISQKSKNLQMVSLLIKVLKKRKSNFESNGIIHKKVKHNSYKSKT